MPSYQLDHAPDHVPVFGNDMVLETADGVDLAIVIQDISNIEYTGEQVSAKDGEGKDQATIYYNRDRRSFSLNGWPVGSTEAEAIAVDVLFKIGTILKVRASTRHPQLAGIFFRVDQAQKTASNTDKVMVSLILKESHRQSWT